MIRFEVYFKDEANSFWKLGVNYEEKKEIKDNSKVFLLWHWGKQGCFFWFGENFWKSTLGKNTQNYVLEKFEKYIGDLKAIGNVNLDFEVEVWTMDVQKWYLKPGG